MKDLKTRLIPAIIAIAIAIPLLQFGWGFGILILVISIGLCIEMLSLQQRLNSNSINILGQRIVSLGMLSWTIYYILFFIADGRWPNHAFHHLPHITFIGFILLGVLVILKKVPINPLSFSWLYPWAGVMALIEIVYDSGAYNPSLFLLLLFSIWASDAGAYVTGNLLGNKKLAPSISPNKTWAGFWGAGLGVLLIVILGKFWLNLSWPLLCVWFFIVWLMSIVGDLFESYLKRRAGIKDSGKFLPGHGGFLDRFDSLLFVAPFVYFVLKFSS